MEPTTLENPNTLFLPPLEFGPVRHSLGSIYHILDSGGTKGISSTEEFLTSPRVRDTLYTLDDGKKILITKKKKFELQPDVDGVLHREDGDDLS